MMQPQPELRITLHQLLKAMIEKGASDMHITTGTPPLLRVDGDVVPLKVPPLSATDSKQLCYSILSEEQKIQFERDQRARSVVRGEEPLPLPRQHLRAARGGGRRVSNHPFQDPQLRRPRVAAGGGRSVQPSPTG